MMNNQQIAPEDLEAIENGLDNAIAGIHEQIAGLASFRAQTDRHLVAITQDLTHQHWLQSATLLPSPFSGNTG